jgi:hypothetical protein
MSHPPAPNHCPLGPAVARSHPSAVVLASLAPAASPIRCALAAIRVARSHRTRVVAAHTAPPPGPSLFAPSPAPTRHRAGPPPLSARSLLHTVPHPRALTSPLPRPASAQKRAARCRCFPLFFSTLSPPPTAKRACLMSVPATEPPRPSSACFRPPLSRGALAQDLATG